MKNKKNDVRGLIVWILLVAIVILTLYSCISSPVLKDILLTLMTIIAAVAVFIQIKEGTDVSRAEFVMNLQETYTSTTGFSELFTNCWKNYNNEVTYEWMMEYLSSGDNSRILLNYLTFFESMYLMKEQGVLNLDILDELFGRRFFIVVNNKAVQDFDLVKNQKYYLNVLYLYNDWSKYRIKRIKKTQDCTEEMKRLFLSFNDKQKVNYRVLSEALD